MSKTDHDIPERRDGSLGPLPSFDAIRADEEPRSDLRRNQTLDLPCDFRQQLAQHELPDLPPEHLRTTDEKDVLLQRSPPGSQRKRIVVIILAVLTAGAIGVVSWQSTQPFPPKAQTQAERLEQPAAVAPTPPSAPLVGSADPPAATVAISASTKPEPEQVASTPQRANKRVERSGAIPRQTKTDDSERDIDPSELMYNPK